jgi:hypothetical protein
VVVATAPGHAPDPPSQQSLPQGCPAQLTQVQRDQFATFINKATGWFTVALGAALLAAGQTWQVIDTRHWPAWVFWLLIVVMLGASVLNPALRMSHDERTAASGAQRAGDASSP